MTLAEEGEDLLPPAALQDALLVYAEPLAENAYVLVIGDAESPVAERLLALGARGVQLYDPDPARAANAARNASAGIIVRPLVGELDVRDGSFDIAIIPDLAELDDAAGVVAGLSRALARTGAVVAMGRARVADARDLPFGNELGPAALDYNELYEAFAGSFDEVTLAGVVPFSGVVFAELGGDESPAVSVDTRFGAAIAPTVFVVIASKQGPQAALDPYAIIEVVPVETGVPTEATLALETAFAAAQLKADLTVSQLENARERLIVNDVQRIETAARLERAGLERDSALTRAMELEAILAASQQQLAMLEQRVLIAEQGALQREEIVVVEYAQPSEPELSSAGEVEIAALIVRVEETEGALIVAVTELARKTAELAQLSEVHGAEIAGYETQLRDRAHVVAALENELSRREQLVKELIASVEEDGGEPPIVFESAPAVSLPPPPPPPSNAKELADLRARLDVLAAEVARRDGELTARAWRIQELEGHLEDAPRPARTVLDDGEPRGALALAQDEIDALRQALTQEHAARLAAESGEELATVRAELGRQAVLLEQVRREQTSR